MELKKKDWNNNSLISRQLFKLRGQLAVPTFVSFSYYVCRRTYSKIFNSSISIFFQTIVHIQSASWTQLLRNHKTILRRRSSRHLNFALTYLLHSFTYGFNHTLNIWRIFLRNFSTTIIQTLVFVDGIHYKRKTWHISSFVLLANKKISSIGASSATMAK